MSPIRTLLLAVVTAGMLSQSALAQKTVTLTTQELQDKIRGGWAAQTIGVTYGGPTEFRYNGTFIPDYNAIPWYKGYLKQTYDNSPGLYDDIYMDLTFVDVFEKKGLDAPAGEFAKAFANAGYMLWHANQQARYNIQNGLEPPATGHWENNPEADDIDFQIEADFAGLMSPALPNAASEYADRIGHIMNYGDGWYGGVYMAAMYSLAFTNDDPHAVVKEALEIIPKQSKFYQTIADVIRWHDQYPDDWKQTWFELQRKWAEDYGCPEGVFKPFNIDAKINAAYVVLGLLYGDGDFGKTIDIATRAGQDSDCNPASAGGILGVMIGYDKLPVYWKQGLDEVEPIDFKYTTISLNDVYDMSYRHALEVIRRNGGTVSNSRVTIPVQGIKTVRFEQSFAGHFPVSEVSLNKRLSDEVRFDFEGIGFAIQGSTDANDRQDHVIVVDVMIDGKKVETTKLPTAFQSRKFIPFFRYNLPEGRHTVVLKVTNPSQAASVNLARAVIYGTKPVTYTK